MKGNVWGTSVTVSLTINPSYDCVLKYPGRGGVAMGWSVRPASQKVGNSSRDKPKSLKEVVAAPLLKLTLGIRC